MPKRIFFAFLAITVIVGIVVTRIVLGERGVEVGKQLGREHIVPVEGHVAVAPSHVHACDVVVALVEGEAEETVGIGGGQQHEREQEGSDKCFHLVFFVCHTFTRCSMTRISPLAETKKMLSSIRCLRVGHVGAAWLRPTRALRS